MNAEVVPVAEDPDVGGLCPKQLRITMDSWPTDKPKPKLLIVCPTGIKYHPPVIVITALITV